MDILQNLLSVLSIGEFLAELSTPSAWGIIFSLVILEGLLSADNAIVLAVMVKSLPEHQQKKALTYGIIGAYLFRFLAVLVGTALIKIMWIKVVGASYLLYLAYSHFTKGEGEEDAHPVGKSFWKTVAAVELMDITFSMDSILAAVGVSDKVWVLFVGGALGITMMRGVAQLFLILVKKYPQLETTAYALIAFIGAKLMLSAFGYHLGEVTFFLMFPLIILVTFFYPIYFKKQEA